MRDAGHRRGPRSPLGWRNLRQLRGEIVTAGPPGGIHLSLSGVRIDQSNVVFHRSVEQQTVLGDDSDLARTEPG